MKNLLDVIQQWQLPRWYRKELIVLEIDEYFNKKLVALTIYDEEDDEIFCIPINKNKVENIEESDIIIVNKEPMGFVRGAHLKILLASKQTPNDDLSAKTEEVEE